MQVSECLSYDLVKELQTNTNSRNAHGPSLKGIFATPPRPKGIFVTPL